MAPQEFYMARAIHLAERGLYSTMPNPRVGCVLVQDNRIVAEGWHQYAGESHAEIHALQQFSGNQIDLQQCSAYVTLEPCSHEGKTPACAEALVASGIKNVIIAMADPNPLVAGAGIGCLQTAGIGVHSGILEKQAEALNPGFIKRMRTGLPLLRCKLAMSLDGRTAMASGESQWITGRAARADVQRWRARSCAVMFGIGSVLADNPAMTVRREELSLSASYTAPRQQPLRVIVDSKGRLPIDAKTLQLPGKILLAVNSIDDRKRYLLENKGVHIELLPAPGGKVDLNRLLQLLGNKWQCNEVLLETGPTLSGAMLQQQLIDELVIYTAPILMGSGARPLMDFPIREMSERQKLKIKDRRLFGNDSRLLAELRYDDR